jgi:hypothetical protein
MVSENFGIQLQGNIVCMGGVVVSVLVLSAVDLCATSGQVLAKTMKCICVASPLSMQYKGVRTRLLRIRIMCPSGAKYVPSDCCL